MLHNISLVTPNLEQHHLTKEHINCGCIIDISTPETTAQGFNAWLHGLQFSPCAESDKESCTQFGSRLEEKSNESDDELRRVRDGTSNRKRFGSRSNKGTGTNLYGRPYCPGRPLSMEDRGRIIELHKNGKKVNAISKELCISHGCVSKIISRFRETGMLCPASSPVQRRPRRTKKSSPQAPHSVPSMEEICEQYSLCRSQSLF